MSEYCWVSILVWLPLTVNFLNYANLDWFCYHDRFCCGNKILNRFELQSCVQAVMLYGWLYDGIFYAPIGYNSVWMKNIRRKYIKIFEVGFWSHVIQCICKYGSWYATKKFSDIFWPIFLLLFVVLGLVAEASLLLVHRFAASHIESINIVGSRLVGIKNT